MPASVARRTQICCLSATAAMAPSITYGRCIRHNKVMESRQGRKIDGELEAAIQAALIAGQRQSDIARHYGLPDSTVMRIRKRMTDTQLQALANTQTQQQTQLDDMLVDLLADNIKAMQGIARTAHDAKYREQQNAAALAKLYDAIATTTLQILNAAAEPGD